MNTEIQLLGVMQDFAFQEKKGSAFYKLFDNLIESNDMSGVVDFSIPSTFRKALFLSNFAVSKKKWKAKDQVDVRRYKIASFFAQKALKNADHSHNSIIQIGSSFNLGPLSPLVEAAPRFSYHDNNLASFLRSVPSGLLSNKRRKEAFKFESEVYQSLSGIFTMSRALRQSFIQDFGLPEEKVVYAGFGSPFEPKDITSKNYGTKNILFIASHSFEAKGGVDLLKAFRRIRRYDNSVTLTIVGRNWNIQEPGVVCKGFLDKRIPEQLRQYKECFESASLFVLPSHIEAFGEVFIEAMSYGLPCIGTKEGVMPELIEANGAGCVVDKQSVDQLTGRITDMLASETLLSQYGAAGCRAVDSEYRWSKVVSRIRQHIADKI